MMDRTVVDGRLAGFGGLQYLCELDPPFRILFLHYDANHYIRARPGLVGCLTP
jgi:hypothetical protein